MSAPFDPLDLPDVAGCKMARWFMTRGEPDTAAFLSFLDTAMQELTRILSTKALPDAFVGYYVTGFDTGARQEWQRLIEHLDPTETRGN